MIGNYIHFKSKIFIVLNKVEVVLGRGLKALRIGAVHQCELTYKGDVCAFRDMTWMKPGNRYSRFERLLHLQAIFVELNPYKVGLCSTSDSVPKRFCRVHGTCL